MRSLKSHVLLRLVNSYIVDSPQPANLSYLWNFGSLLALCLIIQILTGAFLAMHYTPHVDFAFNSVEHIMRDVNNGWLIRYTHANVASFFFIFVYMHVGRGLYYGSYKSPRVLVWSIGTIILILMMANSIMWPNWKYFDLNTINSIVTINGLSIVVLPINKARTKALNRIGPHNKKILDIIISGMLGDFWADKIPGNSLNSIRFNIEQSITNTAYIHYLTLLFYNLGYCSRPVPSLIVKSDSRIENRFNYKVSLFTFTSFNWIYDSFYRTANGKTIKIVPNYIADYLTPLGLAHWIMQDGSYQKGQGVYLATNSFTYEECQFLANILTKKYKFKTSVVKSGLPNQWRISIWKESMPNLRENLEPYFIAEMKYKLGI
jgi:ubiquinol-cytochrome c reductase cytochrome b subunit